MKKVPVQELQPGEVTAQYILDQQGNVLLSAGVMLSPRIIDMLKRWEISEVRIREDADSDEDVRVALALDQLARESQDNVVGDILKEAETGEKPAFAVPGVPPDVLVSLQEIDTILSGEENVPQGAGTERVEQGGTLLIPTIIKHDAMKQYGDAVRVFTNILHEIETTRNMPVESLNQLAIFVTEYVAYTAGVVAYAIKQPEMNVAHGWICRHSLAVATIATKIARLMGYPMETLQTIAFGALLHDIGKVHLPAEVAARKRRLTPDEEAAYQAHVQLGYNLIKDKKWIPREVAIILVQHHERIDGSGFPLKLLANKIHPYAQIVALADQFDLLAHERPGVPNFFDLRKRLIGLCAARIDSAVLDVFDRYLNDFLYNLNVELSDGRKAAVIYLHNTYPSPVVRTSDGEFIDLNKVKNVKVTGHQL